LAGGAALADQQAPLYPNAYWVTGLLRQSLAPAGTYRVVACRDKAAAAAAYGYCDVRVGSENTYAVNLLEDNRFMPAVGESYYVGVVGKPDVNGDIYGVNWKEFTVGPANKGYVPFDLTLVKGQGIDDPTKPPIGPDSGLINHAQIERVADSPGSGIRLQWLYSDALAVKRADIWRLAGAGETYSANKTWLLAAADLSATEWIDNFKDAANNEIKVGNNINAYYRIIPAGTVPGPSSADPKIFDPLNNEKTVGKVDIVLKEQYNAITAPFKLDNYALSALIGEQLAEGDQIHYWNDRDQTYNIMTKTANWPSYTFKEVEGFFVYLSDPQNKGRREYLTLVGFVGGFPAGFTWPLGKEYNLLGYPYPGSDLANTLGFRPNEGDQFHQWNWISQGFTLTTYVGGQWKDEAVTVLALGEGKFYYVPLTSPTDKWELKF